VQATWKGGRAKRAVLTLLCGGASTGRGDAGGLLERAAQGSAKNGEKGEDPRATYWVVRCGSRRGTDVTSQGVDIYELPYCPVPTAQHHEILVPISDALLAREFHESAIRQDYVFTGREPDKLGLKVNEAAFTDPHRWDPTTSGVNFYYNAMGLQDRAVLEGLALTAAPFNLIGTEESVSLYVTSRDGGLDIRRVETDVSYREIPGVFDKWAEDIAPNRIRRVKEGIESFVLFPSVNAVQLRLWAVEATGDILVQQFARAVGTLRDAMSPGWSAPDERNVAVQLLAAVILAHKGVLGQECGEQDAPMGLVMGNAHRMFDRYFTLLDVNRYERAAEKAYSILQEVRYSSFTPEILEDLYLAAYPDSEQRKWEARYCTPSYLTRRVLDNIPVEALPPDERIVADMTCGVGSFLQASYDRLSRLADMTDSERPLREHIFGNDMDRLTSQLAGLSLLLASQTDRWTVGNEDALRWQWLSENRPSIIVGNPPFFGNRKSGAEATKFDDVAGRRVRYQRADDFLVRAVSRLAPGGYVAMLMPQSFVVGQASPITRRLLLECCDVLEIWELPNEVFRDATVRPMVVFARRKPQAESGRISFWPVRVRTVQATELDQFKSAGGYSASRIAVSQKDWGPASKLGPRNTHVIDYRTVLSQGQWAKLTSRTLGLEEVADISLGAAVGSRRPWRDYPDGKQVRWLPGAKRCMPRAYVIEYRGDTIYYPNDLERPRKNRRYPHLDKERLFAGAKVLMVSDPDPTWGHRTKVAIERHGYYPSDGFWVVVPKPTQIGHDSLEVVAAVLGWLVSNAWILEHLKAPKISSRAVRSIPFPRHLGVAECNRLRAAVREMEEVAHFGGDPSRPQTVIDQILSAAYELDEMTLNWLRRVSNWDGWNLAGPAEPPPDPSTLVSVCGGVEAVDASAGTLTLWLDTLPGLHETPIVDKMPGWMLRPGAEFRARVSDDLYRRRTPAGLRWAWIGAQEYGYLTEEELLKRISASLQDT
jgi:hypothetical protein